MSAGLIMVTWHAANGYTMYARNWAIADDVKASLRSNIFHSGMSHYLRAEG